jgi:DNA-binding NarL/FixJ family response regulator
MKHTLILAEDHQLLRQGLCSLISALPDFEVVGDCRDGREVVRMTLTQNPDMVVLDVALPGMSGIDATSQIKRRQPGVRVVALTSYKSDEYVRESLRAGVDGYVLKDAAFDELVMALRSVAAGKKYLSPDVSSALVDNYLNGGRADARAAPWDKLTARERSILKLVAEGRTNRATAEFLNVSPKTVEKHRANLMRKLGLRNVAELTLVALESGLIERPGTVTRLMGPDEKAGAPAQDA